MQTVIVEGYEVYSDSEENARKKLKKHRDAGLKNEFLKKSLSSLYPIEYWLDRQD
jgi:hypothetical protein